jgi:hypothetical protein
MVIVDFISDSIFFNFESILFVVLEANTVSVKSTNSRMIADDDHYFGFALVEAG